MRKSVTMIVGLVLAIGLLAPTASAQSKPKLTLKYALDQNLDNINPAVSGTDVSPFIGRAIFDSLVVQTGKDTFGPWLATSWTVSPDERTYTFKLRNGVKFHDGSAFEAISVKRFLDYVVKPSTKSAFAASLINQAYKETKVIDTSTVQIILSRPYSSLLQALSTPSLGIQSSEAIQHVGGTYRPTGTGPFKFAAWNKNVDVQLTPNTKYTSPPAGAQHIGAPYLAGIRFVFLREAATRYGALTSKQVHAINAVPPNRVDDLTRQSGFAVKSGTYPGLSYNVLLRSNRGVLADDRVRKAFVQSLDIDSLIKGVYFGQFSRARNPITPTTPSYDKGAASALLPYNPKAANNALDDAGWTERDDRGFRTKAGKRLTIVWPVFTPGIRESRDLLGQGIQADAKKVGIEVVRPALTDFAAYTAGYANGTYDLQDYSQVRASGDVLRRAFGTGEPSNRVSLSSAQLDTWLNAGVGTTNATTANKNYASAQRFVMASGYVLPLYSPQYIIGLSTKVQQLAVDASGYADFYDTWVNP